MAVKRIDTREENQSQHYPKGCPVERFLDFYRVCSATENTKIQCQHSEDENTKEYPPQNHVINPLSIRLCSDGVTMSLRGRETTEAISYLVDAIEIATFTVVNSQ
jgi:hypothetical protein